MALKGKMKYCTKHQGNREPYTEDNCAVCDLTVRLKRAEEDAYDANTARDKALIAEGKARARVMQLENAVNELRQTLLSTQRRHKKFGRPL